MKRFAVLLIVLVLVGAVVFYFGWIQIRIPAGSYGVIFTRTNGWDTDVVEPGSFVWRWQRLIPTNLSLYVFEPERHRTSVELEGTLPSGAQIQSLLDESGDFEYGVELVVQTRLVPDELPALARDEGLRPADLPAYYDELDSTISQLATEAVMSLVESQPEQVTMSQQYTSIVDAIRSRLRSRLRYLEVVGVVVEEIDLPDMDVYLTAKQLARDVLQARSQALQEAARRIADAQAQSDRRLAMLERYGEILNEYPVLLDYFRVAEEIDGDPLDLESLVPESSE
jgi:hypothetical protein